MKKNYLIVAVTLGLFLFAASAGAATVSITPMGDYPMAVGDTVNFDVWFTAGDSGDTLDAVSLNLGYDATELSFVGYSYDALEAAGWGEFFSTVEDTGNALANFNVAYLTGSAIELGANESISIGTFTFESTDGLLDDDLADVWTIDNLQVGEIVYSSVISYSDLGVYASSLVTGQGADVAPVPVPAAVWLFGSGLIGLVSLRRKKG